MNEPNPEEPSKVINLATGERVTQIKEPKGYCQGRCESILIDTHKRMLTCRECGATVDAFNWAVRMANSESYLIQNITNLKNERDTHAKNLEDLKAEELRVKNRIRAAKNSLLRDAGI